MTKDHGKGGPQPPADDRTILDPLNADELKALREARERFQKHAASGIGPDSGDDLGDAPTRAMPALPSFESGGGVSLKDLSGPQGTPGRSGSAPKIIADPKPMTPQSARIVPPSAERNPAPPMTGTSPGIGPGAGPAATGPEGSPGAGRGGFGDNTLMWMSPVKIEEQKVVPARGLAAAGGASYTGRHELPTRRPATVMVGVGLALVVATLLYFVLRSPPKPGVVELVTIPPKASVRIDGKVVDGVTTPMKASLAPGPHKVEFTLANHKDEAIEVVVAEGGEATRHSVDLYPLSKPGFLTVSIEIQPVAANITVNGTSYAARKTVRIADLDPKAGHKLAIEAGGYAKIALDIQAGQLKESYHFVLQPEK